jgi:hypothetical protein
MEGEPNKITNMAKPALRKLSTGCQLGGLFIDQQRACTGLSRSQPASAFR